MLVHGAIVPPRTAREAVAEVVRAVPTPAPVSAAVEAPAPRKGLFGRFGGQKAEPVEPSESEHAGPDVLAHVPVEHMYLPVTEFGNLTRADAMRLADAITDAASGWAPVTVRLAGGTALDFPGDWSVWAKLDGDLDALMAIARGVTQSVERLGYFVDRRLFRPMLSVATVTESTTGPYLQDVVDALDAFRGEEWSIDTISLLTLSFDGKHAEPKEFHRIPLAGS